MHRMGQESDIKAAFRPIYYTMPLLYHQKGDCVKPIVVIK